MHKNDQSAPEISSEQKRMLFKKRLQEKTMQKGSSLNCSDTPQSTLKEKIPERFYRVTLFPEFRALKQQDDNFQKLNIKNPYFKSNEGIVNSTTTIDGKEYISFASYNYLGFSGDIRVSEAVKKAVF